MESTPIPYLPCRACDRHIRVIERYCPFCRQRDPTPPPRVAWRYDPEPFESSASLYGGPPLPMEGRRDGIEPWGDDNSALSEPPELVLEWRHLVFAFVSLCGLVFLVRLLWSG